MLAVVQSAERGRLASIAAAWLLVKTSACSIPAWKREGEICRRSRNGSGRKLGDSQPVSDQRSFVESTPLLVALAEASARGVIATGPRRGCRVVRVRGVAADVDAFVMGRLCAQVEGYNLQAATPIAANDRDGLERMARYLARPPIATDRLAHLEDGRLELRLKTGTLGRMRRSKVRRETPRTTGRVLTRS